MGNGEPEVRELVTDYPDQVNEFIYFVDGIDASRVSDEYPEAVTRIQNLLWEIHSVKVERYEALSDSIDSTTSANYESKNGEFSGHIRTDASTRTISGGAGHIEDADLRIIGPSEVLKGIATGSVDPIRAHLLRMYTVDGSYIRAGRLAKILRRVTRRM
ncbi:MAG: hypothetical protein SV760_00180 [Halobacteria archaeon]|nr:hypothetical protein [Halobacteria archaeon]